MNEVITDCVKYGLNVGAVAGCLLALGILAMRNQRPKVSRRRPMTLGEALIAKHRKGISLIEVLMSIFILSIGVLGVAALFPLAAHLSQGGAVADRSAIAGRAALRDFKVRGMDCPAIWRTPSNGMVRTNVNDRQVTGGSPFTASVPGAHSFCLDPRGIAHGITQAFPAGGSVTMPRITLVNSYFTEGSPMQYTAGNIMQISQADEVFSFHDDLVFTVNENDPTVPPEQFIERANYNNPLPAPQKRFADRQFSWFATITREANSEQYNVSVVVIEGRAMNAAAELQVAATVLGGIGGGEVTLTGDETTGPQIQANVKPGRYICLMHVTRVQWYRVLTVSDYDAANYRLTVSLSGADWDIANGFDAPKAVVMPGIVGVYDRTLTLKAEPY